MSTSVDEAKGHKKGDTGERAEFDRADLNFLFKGLWGRPKGGLSSRSTGILAHCCHETGEYRAMRNGPCTPIPDRLKKQVVAN